MQNVIFVLNDNNGYLLFLMDKLHVYILISCIFDIIESGEICK